MRPHERGKQKGIWFMSTTKNTSKTISPRTTSKPSYTYEDRSQKIPTSLKPNTSNPAKKSSGK